MRIAAIQIAEDDVVMQDNDPSAELKRKILRDGYDLLVKETDKPITLRMIVWRLFQEAALTHKAISGPGQKPIKSCMPEQVRTEAEIVEVEAEMVRDKITYPDNRRPSVSPSALDRYTEVMSWLRVIRSHNVPRAQKAFFALASGASMRRVAVKYGFDSSRSVESLRKRSLDLMCQRLRQFSPVPSHLDKRGKV